MEAGVDLFPAGFRVIDGLLAFEGVDRCEAFDCGLHLGAGTLALLFSLLDCWRGQPGRIEACDVRLPLALLCGHPAPVCEHWRGRSKPTVEPRHSALDVHRYRRFEVVGVEVLYGLEIPAQRLFRVNVADERRKGGEQSLQFLRLLLWRLHRPAPFGC